MKSVQRVREQRVSVVDKISLNKYAKLVSLINPPSVNQPVWSELNR